MLDTGIVRRIDHLGRIVIPKELCRTMRISQGDLLHVFTNGDEIIFRPEHLIRASFAQALLKQMHSLYPVKLLVCDTEKVVAVAGYSRKEYALRPITAEFRHTWRTKSSNSKGILPIEGMEDKLAAAYPVLAGIDPVGAVFRLQSGDSNAELADKVMEIIGVCLLSHIVME